MRRRCVDGASYEVADDESYHQENGHNQCPQGDGAATTAAAAVRRAEWTRQPGDHRRPAAATRAAAAAATSQWRTAPSVLRHTLVGDTHLHTCTVHSQAWTFHTDKPTPHAAV